MLGNTLRKIGTASFELLKIKNDAEIPAILFEENTHSISIEGSNRINISKITL